MIGYILIGLVVIIALWLISTYNNFIVLQNRMGNAESQIDVQLKKRFDLVPNLVETVKGYAKHEKGVFTEVSQARNALVKAGDILAKSKANAAMTSALGRLFAVAEAYPQLKANENFLMLQEELSGIESKIAYARQFFNDSVLNYNNSVERFPGNIIGNLFNFKEKPFFEMDEKEKKPVKVEF
ncbi:MAG: LemA family protein [Candidatus Woesearchaeota archaeon]